MRRLPDEGRRAWAPALEPPSPTAERSQAVQYALALLVALALVAVAGAVHAAARMLASATVAEPPVALGRLERVGLAVLALLLVVLAWVGAPLYRWAALAAAQLP